MEKKLRRAVARKLRFVVREKLQNTPFQGVEVDEVIEFIDEIESSELKDLAKDPLDFLQRLALGTGRAAQRVLLLQLEQQGLIWSQLRGARPKDFLKDVLSLPKAPLNSF